MGGDRPLVFPKLRYVSFTLYYHNIQIDVTPLTLLPNFDTVEIETKIYGENLQILVNNTPRILKQFNIN